MKYFATKREAWITGAIAAFFVLVALAFTFEPLVTVIVSSKNLPAGAILSAKISANEESAQVYADGLAIISILGIKPIENPLVKKASMALISSISGEKNLTIVAKPAGSLPITAELSGNSVDPDSAEQSIYRVAAYFDPTENRVIMPDNTSYIEIVADPDKANPDKLPIPISINSFKNQITVSTSKKQLDKGNYYLSPTECWQLPSGVNIINYSKISDNLVNNIISGIRAYFRDFQCFQNFSTFD
jgi:hypothetical protein